MKEAKWNMTITKDAMLFITNDILGNDIKEYVTKEKILKMMPQIYEKATVKELVKMLPNETYKLLEKLIKYIETSDDAEAFVLDNLNNGVDFLEEIMVLTTRERNLEINNTINYEVVEALKKIYSAEGKNIAKRYSLMENLIIGMLKFYGVVEYNFFKTQLCNYMNEILSDDEISDFIFKRLNLNYDVQPFEIALDESGKEKSFIALGRVELEDYSYILSEQSFRGFNYKKFDKLEVLNKAKGEMGIKEKRFYDYLKSKCQFFNDFMFEELYDVREKNEDVMSFILDFVIIENMDEAEELMKMYTTWSNDTPMQVLGGYTPNEMFKKAYGTK